MFKTYHNSLKTRSNLKKKGLDRYNLESLKVLNTTHLTNVLGCNKMEENQL
jgi:hypothetical protein